MLTQWHRTDIFTALNNRKWEGPWPNSLSEEESRYVGESYTFRRNDEELKVYFVADFGDGYSGVKSIEAAIGVGVGRMRVVAAPNSGLEVAQATAVLGGSAIRGGSSRN